MSKNELPFQLSSHLSPHIFPNQNIDWGYGMATSEASLLYSLSSDDDDERRRERAGRKERKESLRREQASLTQLTSHRGIYIRLVWLYCMYLYN